MARINRRKQRRNLSILAIGLIVFGFTVSMLVQRITNLFVEEETVKEPVPVEEKLTSKDYAKYGIDESGNIPVMMYHGIHDIPSSQTGYTGGNVDVDGYQRTAQAFRQDLEFYYKNNYRMVRLKDYVEGNIDCDAKMTPLVLTFDDGLENNILVTGLDAKGEIQIDPNSAVGILESFKKKYPDFNVTATFFVNGGLFNQPEYNDKILHWLIDHGYDIGNHTYSHVDFTTATPIQSMEEVGIVYDLLDQIIPGQYVNIIALPFGSPYTFDHQNMPSILKASYNGKVYHTQTALQVAWEADYSPYSASFDPSFIKRIRAYDNEGQNFDIAYNFEVLESTRYISDGKKDTIVIPKEKEANLGNTHNKKVIVY